MSAPKKIKLNKENKSLSITWADDSSNNIPLKLLRDESPDATNKGETILWKHYEPAPQGPDKPGKYEVDKIELVGNYAIQVFWKDGYDYGIYSWDILKRLGEFAAVKKDLSD